MAKNSAPQKIFSSPLQFFKDVLYLITGSILTATAINGILIPQQFATGGLNGIALITYNHFPIIDMGTLYLLLNVPLFILAWMSVGRRFFFYSVIGTLSLSAALMFVNIPISLDDKILNALLAGIIIGVGAGISLKSVGSLGGMDLLSVILLKRFSISIGTTILVTNALILTLVAFSYSLDAVIYTLIVIYVASKLINIVLTGLSQRKSVLIISPEYKEIESTILHKLNRGVTVINGIGAYTGKEEHILYSVVTIMELGQLKKIIQNIDPDAFVVISNTMEVMNYRIGNQPHW